jgi:hypothetical protein
MGVSGFVNLAELTWESRLTRDSEGTTLLTAGNRAMDPCDLLFAV